nr:MAG TPA: hypothetical protein [Caudoviricetes sp.]
MIDKLEYLNDDENKYPMAFTINVMESVEDEYGGIENWAKLMDKTEPSYKALKFMVLEIINEGIDIENENLKDDNKKELLTSKQVGRLITRIGMDEIGVKVFKLIQGSLPKGDKSKNGQTMKNLKK